MRGIEILNERFVNLIGVTDQHLRDKYRDQVWAILQRSYAGIGGIQGSGFESPEAMDSIPMWKLIALNGEIQGVVMYKDKQGRKLVAIGTNGSPYAKAKVEEIMRNDLKRSYGENSKAALGFVMKKIPWEILKDFVMEPFQVQQVLGKEIIPIKRLDRESWPLDAQLTITNYPQLINYGYLRELGGELVFKVMIGSPNNQIF